MTDGTTTPGSGLVSPEAVALDEPVTGRRDCVERLVELADATGRVDDREVALRAVFDREAEGPTGVGEGVALPHARTDAVAAPTLAFVHVREAVDFGGPDDADLLFLLLVPESDDVHLSVLSRLARALLDGGVRERLRTAETPAVAARVLREVVA